MRVPFRSQACLSACAYLGPLVPLPVHRNPSPLEANSYPLTLARIEVLNSPPHQITIRVLSWNYALSRSLHRRLMVRVGGGFDDSQEKRERAESEAEARGNFDEKTSIFVGRRGTSRVERRWC
ncbi:hypothetical protein JAAARDRAFT_638995 [Jaapia argillacea MUCL 33604]|uniref:Uncharacterized protein n=1 Tax=Jaapia argillacea MUCL 33604 TaxID=933084 RepID=A0A067P3X6_9AGAM|nr:hypothetical protein JAAARDRAFT_638995 [Jaapia argillacea MUCL 33604]